MTKKLSVKERKKIAELMKKNFLSMFNWKAENMPEEVFNDYMEEYGYSSKEEVIKKENEKYQKHLSYITDELKQIAFEMYDMVALEKWEEVFHLADIYSEKYIKNNPDFNSPNNFLPFFEIYADFFYDHENRGLVVNPDPYTKIKYYKKLDELQIRPTFWPFKAFIAETYEELGDKKNAKYWWKKQQEQDYDALVYESRTIKTDSGIFVQSEGEKKIANFLTKHQIDYDYDKQISLKGVEIDSIGRNTHWVRPDFFLTEFSIIIEYWGMVGDVDYDSKMESKKRLYKESKSKFISITKEQLKDLDKVLTIKLERLGCKIFE